MKNKKILDAFSQIDEAYVEEANPQYNQKKPPIVWKKLAYLAVAACLMLMIVLPVLFLGEGASPIPAVSSSEQTQDNIPSHLAEYQDSPYYPLIERLDAYYNKGSSNASPNTPTSEQDPTEATEIEYFPLFPDETWTPSFAYINSPDEPIFPNNLSDGVAEADHIAHSDTHVFHLIDNMSLDVYSADGAESKLVSSLSLEGTHYGDMHLLNGGKQLLLMGTNSSRTVTELLCLDVSDPANMKEVKRISLNGWLQKSYLSDGSILFHTLYWLSDTLDFHEVASFVPTVTDGDQVTSLPCDHIIFPKSLTEAKYSILYLFDAETLAFEGGNAFLGEEWEEVYLYGNYVLAADTGNRITKTEGRYDFKGGTTLHCFPYGNGSFDYQGAVTVDGYLNTYYSLEEHDGILRVVTAAYYLSYKDSRIPSTPSVTPPQTVVTTADPFAEDSPEMAADEGVVMLSWTEEELQYYNRTGEYSGSNLYCISLENLEVVASLERFSQDGQTPLSIWFDGDLIQVTVDAPFANRVFSFDLSDLSNITYTSTTDENNFSYTLRYDEDTVLRVGYEERWVMRIELYRESDDGLMLLDQYVKENVRLEEDYQSYYIDFDKKLFGIYFAPYQGRDDLGDFYILFSFASGKLERIVEVNEEWFGRNFRATYVNGYLYMFGDIFPENFFRIVKAEEP